MSLLSTLFGLLVLVLAVYGMARLARRLDAGAPPRFRPPPTAPRVPPPPPPPPPPPTGGPKPPRAA